MSTKTKEQLQKELDDLLIDIPMYETAGAMLGAEGVKTVISISTENATITIQPRNAEHLKDLLTANNWRYSSQIETLKKEIELFDKPARDTKISPVPVYAPTPIDLDELPI